MEPVPRPGVGSLTYDAASSPSAAAAPDAAAASGAAASAVAPGFDAVVLAGGRASRLGGYPKPLLSYRGVTLLDRALAAVAEARATAVVGPGPGEPGGPALPSGPAPGPGGGLGPPRRSRLLVYTREEPRFAGPLAALGAGLAALRSAPGPLPVWVAVLAADLPLAVDAVVPLLASAVGDLAGDGLLGVDQNGRIQPLLAVYRRDPLEAVLAGLAAQGGLADRPMKHLVARLDLLPLALPPRASDDVDTWDAARSWGIERPEPAEARDATPRQEEGHD